MPRPGERVDRGGWLMEWAGDMLVPVCPCSDVAMDKVDADGRLCCPNCGVRVVDSAWVVA